MKLYLMQHGEAMSKAEAPERPLNAQGQGNVNKVAAFLARAGVHIDQIRHSGKCRAAETAAIIAEALVTDQRQRQNAVVGVSGLNPNDDVQPAADSLRRETNDIMLVGHLPFLSRLAGHLLTGDPERTLVQFKNAGVVCLDYQQEAWTVVWSVIPELVV